MHPLACETVDLQQHFLFGLKLCDVPSLRFYRRFNFIEKRRIAFLRLRFIGPALWAVCFAANTRQFLKT
jgi:hypothetical protein